MSTKILVFLAGIMLFVSPAFAATLNVSFTNLAQPLPYVNTYQNASMLNMTMTASDGTVNVTGVNIDLIGTATSGNISNVMLYNSTGGAIGSNSVWSSSTIQVNITNGLVVTATDNLVVVYSIAGSALSGATVGANITANTSIITNETVYANQYNSSLSQIQSLHASASISPKYVDTKIINQSFTYTVTPSGRDFFNKTKITVPNEYPIVTATATFGSCNPTPSITENNITIGMEWNQFSLCNITIASPLTVIIKINTSSSVVASSAFTSAISGENITDVPTDVSNFATNVTTQELIKIVSVEGTKLTAILNGSDYWEFKFTVNITAPVDVPGLAQFKMSNWNDSTNIMVLNSTNLATLRNTSTYSSASAVNITTDYPTDNVGVSLNKKGISYLYLRQVIGRDTPVSSTWWTTYWMLFRATS